MKQTVRILIPLAFCLAAIIPGCYTIMVHPNDEASHQATQLSDCTRCHDDFHEYPYGYYYSPYPSYWWEYENYGYYYAYPWWWSYYDYPYLVGDDYYTKGSGRKGTKFDRRETERTPVRPPYSLPYGDDYSSIPQPDQHNYHSVIFTDYQNSGVTQPSGDKTYIESSSRSKENEIVGNVTHFETKTTRTGHSPAKEQATVKPAAEAGNDNQSTSKSMADKNGGKKSRRGGRR